ncbi:MAG: 4Fe-4S binding protein [Saprospiraceae bacterium]|nr:4Fe-4S binding protein [Saprospiraceae bacterium]
MNAKLVKNIGLGLFLIALGIFTTSLFLSEHILTKEHLEGKDAVIMKMKNNKYHAEVFRDIAQDLVDQPINTNIAFISEIRPRLTQLQEKLKQNWDENKDSLTAQNVGEWTYKLGDYDKGRYLYAFSKYTAGGTVPNNALLFFLLSFILGSIGALLYYFPDTRLLPGIKHNGIYHSSATKGVPRYIRLIFVAGITAEIAIYVLEKDALLLMFLVAAFTTIVSVITYQENSQTYKNTSSKWGQIAHIIGVVLFVNLLGVFGWLISIIVLIVIFLIPKQQGRQNGQARSASPEKGVGWIGLATALYFIAFYVLLYMQPAYITNWILMVEPLKEALNGGEASEWFLYGVMYCLIMMVTAVRMYIKYRHNKYQKIRTASVVFFQAIFAFLLPEMLANMSDPGLWASDLKNAWPLNYSIVAHYEIPKMEGSTSGVIFGIWMILLSFIVIPILTYIFGKRFYCSWVCGCGGLAETLGDPYRQLSDKSIRAWRIERWVINGVMIMAFSMTIIILIGYYWKVEKVFGVWYSNFFDWYKFLIGSTIFAGIVGTGFYPIMGNRVWCRYGCPLAGMMGLVQRFQSRFRITSNGGQCISCGNCSTYCEMGIDVRHYAQRGQDIVRSSCVGCGVCAAVCPRGVLRLENSSEGVNERAKDLRVIHVQADDVKIL